MLKTRVLTAAVLLPVVLATLFLAPALGWLAFVVLACAVGAWEWGRLGGLSGVQSWILPVLVAVSIAALAVLPFLKAVAPALVLASVLFWLMLAPLWVRFRWPLAQTPLSGMLPGFLILVAAGVALAELRGLVGPLGVLAIMAVAWVADTFAYFSGKAFGKRKLAPAISPGKTVEGAIGGLVMSAVYGAVVAVMTAMPVLPVMVATLLLAVLSIEGDLLESLFKRQAGLKDSSNLLPGHGGVLDRIDSLLAMLPLAMVFVLYL
ncbi:phosphatidate cytidylyltransferase [Chitinibacteraceae bacterium HSL-7]